ncbi:MAG TPA: helix-hairpin-helix domain-containing protein [Puia sp.]|nr:helix-hairpin-helix domain-containing protein [Puia sp.]
MLKDHIKEYFSFTKKERTGIFILLAVIMIVFLVPHFFLQQKVKSDKQAFEQFKNEIAQLKPEKKDSDKHDNLNSGQEDAYEKKYDNKSAHKEATELFYFDPNTATADEWKKLGMPHKTIKTILHYISKGGKFLKPDELKKIYGLSLDKYEQLFPYIKIKNEYASQKADTANISTQKKFTQYKHKEPEPIDINEADTSSFLMLPGIGSRLANRIINFRNRLGGFYSAEQVAETYNLPDSTFQKIKPFLKVGSKSVNKININTADVSDLKVHPLIKWNIANAIVQYRQQHGNYKSIEDLQQITIITPEIFEKISPYLKTNNR